jgi:hypothetical protein
MDTKKAEFKIPSKASEIPGFCKNAETEFLKAIDDQQGFWDYLKQILEQQPYDQWEEEFIKLEALQAEVKRELKKRADKPVDMEVINKTAETVLKTVRKFFFNCVVVDGARLSMFVGKDSCQTLDEYLRERSNAIVVIERIAAWGFLEDNFQGIGQLFAQIEGSDAQKMGLGVLLGSSPLNNQFNWIAVNLLAPVVIRYSGNASTSQFAQTLADVAMLFELFTNATPDQAHCEDCKETVALLDVLRESLITFYGALVENPLEDAISITAKAKAKYLGA